MPLGWYGPPRAAMKSLCDTALGVIVNNWPAPNDVDNPAVALPARQYVANGEVFWDCEQLVVAVERIFGMDGDPAVEQWQSQGGGAGFRGFVMTVMLLRCCPDIDSSGEQVIIPPAMDIDASAVDILGDAVTVPNLLLAAQQADEFATVGGLSFLEWLPAGPMGGFGGGITRMRVAML